MSDLTAQQALYALRVVTFGRGGISAWAARHDIPVSVVSETLAGKREMGEPVANALGLVKITIFREIAKIRGAA